ncbi:MAG: hypothetical protein H6Q43_367, partial [Deltaproteobacteria bacterium]|nr:hypothetical protein [Deltaproteobacteria bacterium]
MGMSTHFYGFSEKPFQVRPDPIVFFFTESQQKVIEA